MRWFMPWRAAWANNIFADKFNYIDSYSLKKRAWNDRISSEGTAVIRLSRRRDLSGRALFFVSQETVFL